MHIKYTFQGGEYNLYPAPEMFDSNSRTRQFLRSTLQLDFQNDNEVLQWIIAKDIPESATDFVIES